MKEFKALTKRGQALRYRKALIQALERYAIDVNRVQFVSVESKPVFRVFTDSGCFAAKFQNPKEHLLSQMAGELKFLHHVSRLSELRVETPLANSEGEFITDINSKWLPEPAHVALCNWLPGRELKDQISVRAYRTLGKCSALLHKVSPSFRPGRKFRILTNDRVFYWDKETLLSRKDRKLLPARRQELFKKAARLTQRAITKIWKSGKPIVIHNDLHPCNIKVHRGQLYLFDFEDITWGFPAQDIGTALYHVRFRDDYRELLGAFREGYEEVLPWPLESDKQLDRFAMARLLMFANYVVNYGISPVKYLRIFETNLGTLLSGSAS